MSVLESLGSIKQYNQLVDISCLPLLHHWETHGNPTICIHQLEKCGGFIGCSMSQQYCHPWIKEGNKKQWPANQLVWHLASGWAHLVTYFVENYETHPSWHCPVTLPVPKCRLVYTWYCSTGSISFNTFAVSRYFSWKFGWSINHDLGVSIDDPFVGWSGIPPILHIPFDWQFQPSHTLVARTPTQKYCPPFHGGSYEYYKSVTVAIKYC